MLPQTHLLWVAESSEEAVHHLSAYVLGCQVQEVVDYVSKSEDGLASMCSELGDGRRLVVAPRLSKKTSNKNYELIHIFFK